VRRCIGRDRGTRRSLRWIPGPGEGRALNLAALNDWLRTEHDSRAPRRAAGESRPRSHPMHCLPEWDGSANGSPFASAFGVPEWDSSREGRPGFELRGCGSE
jgi:hypothetical protein